MLSQNLIKSVFPNPSDWFSSDLENIFSHEGFSRENLTSGFSVISNVVKELAKVIINSLQPHTILNAMGLLEEQCTATLKLGSKRKTVAQ